MSDLPAIESIRNIRLKVPLEVYTIDGRLIAQFGNHKRIPVTIDHVPKTLINAITAAEDDRFFHHYGIDITGVARALIANIRSGDISQGASTITMQVARNYFLSREKTYIRKVKEILLAIKLEQKLCLFLCFWPKIPKYGYLALDPSILKIFEKFFFP